MSGIEAEPEVAEALRVVLSAGRPERFKVLTIACDQDKIVGRLYRTSLGLVLVAEQEGVKGEHVLELPTGDTFRSDIRGPRGGRHAALIASELDAVEGMGHGHHLQCRCGTVYVREGHMLDAIAAGQKRLRVSHV